jgi:ribosomal protein S21
VRVSVEPGKIEQALKVLKRKLQAEGIVREMRQHEWYEKPSERKRRKKAMAIRRYKKALRKQEERDRAR